MKTILGSWIHRYVKRLGPLLITVALIAGLAGCDGSCSCAPIQHDLTISGTEGGQVIIEGEGTYADGTVVRLEAVADECYEFVSWTGAEVTDPYSPITFVTMDEAKSITANFALLSYDLTVDSTDGGQVTSPEEGTHTYDCGADVDLVATPDAYYGFVEWTGDVDTIADVYADSTTITMKGDYSITANFGLFAGGNGTAEDPYQIADWYHLDNVRNYLSSHFIVINDLDFSSFGYTELASATANEEKGWEPIGTIAVNNTFVGSFDGQGYEISDLFIDRPAEENIGLFGVIAGSAVVEDVGVVNADVTGMNYVGGLLGYNNHATVTDCYFSGSLTGNDKAGGLLGYNDYGNITDSYSGGSVSGNGQVGGLMGYNDDGGVSNSYSTGSVTGNWQVGGLVGYTDEGTVSNSYSSANVTGELRVGGLVGRNDDGGVSNSYSTGSTTGNEDVGGLVGYNCGEGTVSNSYSSANVTGELRVGGLVGRIDDGTVSNSHSTGSVTGSNYVGGLLGYIDEGTVSNSYSSGNVTGDSDVGGLVGYNCGDGTVSNSFWDTETSGQATSDGGSGKTTEEMMDFDTFDGVGWDITTVDPGETNPAYTWNIVDTVTYPFLSWESIV